MRWIFLILAAFGIIGGVAIAYWRQTGAEVTPFSMLTFVILLPSAIVGGIYAIYRFRKWKKKQQEEKEAATLAAANSDMTLAEGPAAPWLHVYAIAAQTQLGDHADKVILGLQTLSTAESDDVLFQADGSHLLSRRIDLDISNEIDSDLVEENSSDESEEERVQITSLSDRAARIKALTQSLLVELDQALTTISSGMTQAQTWQTPTQSSQAILHPAWRGQVVDIPQPELIDTQAKAAWPKLLHVLYLLPAHIDDVEQQYLQGWARNQLIGLGFQSEHLQWHFATVSDADQTLQAIGQTFLERLVPTEATMLLVIGADSAIDQDLIDQIQLENELFIPAEAGFALLMTHETTTIPRLPVLARLSAPILPSRQKPLSVGGQIRAEALTTGIEQLRQVYGIPESALVPEDGLIMTDIHPMRGVHLRELTIALRPLDLSTDHLIYTGLLLENTSTMIAGLTLALALQQVESSQLHVPIINSAGDAVRGVWIAAPFVETPLSDDTDLAESESKAG